MHIGMITACYEPVVNGVTQMVAQYEKNLTAAGHEVTVFTLGKPVPGEEPGRTVRSPAIPLGKTGYHVTPRYSATARNTLREVDIIHCHHPVMGLEFARRYGQAPVVFTSHTRYDLYLSSYSHMPSRLAIQLMGITWRRLAKLADTVIAPSASIRSLLLATGIDVPIEVIENGIDIDRFQHVAYSLTRADLHIPEEALVYAYLGRLAPEKSILRLVDEFRMAASRSDRVYFLGLGEGPLQKKVARLIERYGLEDRSRFVGHVAPERVPAYLVLSDVFVSASVTEVHPLAAIEAMAAGLPIVAVDSPGFRDIVLDNKSGLLVDGTKGSLARAMNSLASDDMLRARLATGARKAAKRFDIQFTIERTLSLYRSLVAEGHSQKGQAKASDYRRQGIWGQGWGAKDRFANVGRSLWGDNDREQ
jgi:glycosyltransferase involved in cell wall biosynthesis